MHGNVYNLVQVPYGWYGLTPPGLADVLLLQRWYVLHAWPHPRQLRDVNVLQLRSVSDEHGDVVVHDGVGCVCRCGWGLYVATSRGGSLHVQCCNIP